MAEPAPLDRRYQPSPDVRATLVDGSIVLLNLDTDLYFSLNRTGSCVWGALEAGGSGQDALAAVLGRFDVPEATAISDLRQLLQRLSDAGLILVQP